MLRLKALGEGRTSACGVLGSARAAMQDSMRCKFSEFENRQQYAYKYIHLSLEESGDHNVSTATRRLARMKSKSNANRDIRRFVRLPLETYLQMAAELIIMTR